MEPLHQELEQKLRSAIARHSLDEHYDAIRGRARLTFLLRVTPVEDPSAAPIGDSRLGGTPDLPPSMTWAKNPDDDLLLDFIGQINLQQLPDLAQDLPRKGLLYIFAQQEGGLDNPYAVQYLDAITDDLERSAAPDEDGFSDAEAPHGALLITEFIPSVSLPYSLEECGVANSDLSEEYDALVSELHQDAAQEQPSSRILGYPSSSYGSLLPDQEWELLIQAESYDLDEEAYMTFWDRGSLHVVAKKAAFPNCRFDECRVTVESF